VTTHAKLVHAVHVQGIANAEDVVAAAHSRGVPLSVACAMLDQESHGANVFGHDPVRRGQVVGGRVTRARYARYKFLRRRGYGNQGVGPCQLTSPGLQDAADRLGGCWKPLHNMEVGFSFLVSLKHEFGSWQLAFQHYNGAGPAAVAYGQRADADRLRWHDRFEAAL
jgi:hypothetical protein